MKKKLLFFIINIFICIAVVGCMKINNTEYTEDVSEKQNDMELYSYKMEFHKYPEIAELIEIIKTNAKIKKDFIFLRKRRHWFQDEHRGRSILFHLFLYVHHITFLKTLLYFSFYKHMDEPKIIYLHFHE